MNIDHITNLRFREDVSTQARKLAKQQTIELLEKVDIKTCDEIRRSFDLPPEALGFVTEIYAAVLSAPDGEQRTITSISSAVHYTAGDKTVAESHVPAHKKVTLKVAIVGDVFLPARFVVSNAGTVGGAADWLIEDLRCDGKSQFKQPGPVPGDVFATNSMMKDEFVDWHRCEKSIELDVSYIGQNDEGCPFFAAMIGRTTLSTSPPRHLHLAP